MSRRVLAFCLLLTLLLRAEPFQSVRMASQPRALQTAITHYQGPHGVRVDLVAALHIADPAYYDELNRRFRSYDAVLFEGVSSSHEKPEKAPPKPEPKAPAADDSSRVDAGQLLTGTQVRLARMLGLSFQLEAIDYSAKNFVHADLSMDEIGRTMKRNKETSGGLLFRVLRASLNNSETPDPRTAGAIDMWLITGEITPENRRRVKLYMARTMSRAEDFMADVGGTALINARDERVIEVLEKQIKSGRKRIAIFYGAGHGTDLDRRLREKLKLKRGSQDWLESWSL